MAEPKLPQSKQAEQRQPTPQIEQKKTAASIPHKKIRKKVAKSGNENALKSPKKDEKKTLRTAWIGVDRDYFDTSGKEKSHPDLAWIKILYDNSNCRLCGCYVSGVFNELDQNVLTLSEKKLDKFTKVSQRCNNGWMDVANQLTDIGYGIMLFYVGYSDEEQTSITTKDTEGNDVISWRDDPKNGVWLPSKNDLSDVRALGVLHGKHIRSLINRLGGAWTGAMVLIDNENNLGGRTANLQPYNKLSDRLKEYYLAIFNELERPDSTLPALRSGWYGKTSLAAELLSDRADLFIWEARYFYDESKENPYPYDPSKDPIEFSLHDNECMNAISVKQDKTTWKTWPLGRQFRCYNHKIPIRAYVSNAKNNSSNNGKKPISATVERLQREHTLDRSLDEWRSIEKWDLNTSLVRNPSFPIAEPRIAGRRFESTTTVVLRGRFQSRESKQDVPHMKIDELGLTSTRPIVSDINNRIEPESPIILTQRARRIFLLIIMTDGRIGESVRDDKGEWTKITPIATKQAALRRIRALCAAPRFDEDSKDSDQVALYVSKDDRLYFMRRTANDGSAGWCAGQLIEKSPKVHPFSSLCATERYDGNIEAFYLDELGLLTRIYSSINSPQFEKLEKAASLLKGSRLACTMLAEDRILVAGIGTDLRLRIASYCQSRGWSEMVSLGKSTDRIGPHSSLSLSSSDSGTKVAVLALSPLGAMLVFSIARTGEEWTLRETTTITDPADQQPGTNPAAPLGILSEARGWKINPLGDLVFFGGATQEVYCAGIKDKQHQVLVRKLDGTSVWQNYTA